MPTSIGLPTVVAGRGNAFAIKKQQAAAAEAAAAAAAAGASVSETPLPPLSALPSPPKMEKRVISSASSRPVLGNNKPLPLSPPSEYDPFTSAGLKKGAMHHYLPSPRHHLPGTSPLNPHLNELETVRTLQQKYEAHSKLLEKHGSELVRLEKKMDDFSAWTQEQFRDVVERFGNMSQANSDMFAKQTQLSYDIAKSRLELKNELKSEIYEMRAEINGLTASFSDLSAKDDICLQRLWNNSDETFIEHQCRKNELVQEDLKRVKNQLDYLKQLVIRVRVGLTIAQPNHALSYTPVATQPPATPGLATGLTPSPSMGREGIHLAKRTLSKQISTPQFSFKRSPNSKLNSGLLRSASGPASAFRAAKEAIDKQDVTAENNKLWGLFNRRHRNASDTSSGKFPWSGRRQKQDVIAGIPPVPSIPKGIARIHGDTKIGSPVDLSFGYPMENIHPALRPRALESPDTHRPITGPSEKTSPIEAQKAEVDSLSSTYSSSPAETRAPGSPVVIRDVDVESKEDIPTAKGDVSVTKEDVSAIKEVVSK
jgi:hypothetical protein